MFDDGVVDDAVYLGFLPLQEGDVPASFADISAIQRDTGFAPTTPIDVGIPRFVDWYRRYHNLVG